MNNKTTKILIVQKSQDYELIDSGNGEKLERFGKFVLSRPDPQALWEKGLGKEAWSKADAVYAKDDEKAGWKYRGKIDDKWSIDFAGIKFFIKPTPFKHVGIFPEQASNWQWLEQIIKNINGEQPEVLNLFGYTGGASLISAKSGAKVVHIDSSKSAIAWGRENAEASGLADKPIRWILEDARTFVEREIKRERKYDGIIMDPPAFGHGPDNEVWKIEQDFIELVNNCFKILKEKPSFFLINGYSAGYSALAYENLLKPLLDKFGGEIEIGELAIKENKDEKTARLLPCGIFSRWKGINS